MTNLNGRILRSCGAVALVGAVLLGGAVAAPAAAAPTVATKTGDNPSPPGKPKSSGGTVHPGAFCGNRGATGTSSSGNRYSCLPDKHGRLRWLRK